jgi:hypothetical protein
VERTIELALNRFEKTPDGLRILPHNNQPIDELSVSLAGLYHHYYLDTYGITPPDPDPAKFEYLRFLAPTQDLRFVRDGLGANQIARRHRAAELGQAMCRQFLHDHLGICYFAHMGDVLGKKTHPAFGGLSIRRVGKGDVPDYFCARDVRRSYIAEAKGRQSAISFVSGEFAGWRKQFSRIEVRDGSGSAIAIKGFIVASRFATESRPSVRSALFAEDPNTEGLTEGDGIDMQRFSVGVISLHYAGIARKMGIPLLAASLETGTPLPVEVRIPAAVWEVQVAPLKGSRFVGGYFGSTVPRGIQWVDDPRAYFVGDPGRIDRPFLSFFGLEESVFRSVVGVARSRVDFAAGVAQVGPPTAMYSGMSLLRDGSMLAPLEFLRMVTMEVFE